MKILVITECDRSDLLEGDILDLTKTQVRDCIGCRSCWWKTPGRCVFHDADDRQ